jgi:hypothetical protein
MNELALRQSSRFSKMPSRHCRERATFAPHTVAAALNALPDGVALAS